MRITYQDNSVFKLVVELRDAEDNLFDPAVGPTVDIFAPADDLTDDTSADVLNASVSSLGDVGQQGANLVIRESIGLYSYTFPILADSTIGSWTDRWSFTQDSVATTVDFNFEVLTRSRIESATLTTNSCILITLDSSIADEDGTLLGVDEEIRFWTEFTPVYTSTSLVMAEVGGYLRGVDESSILLAIYQASLDADVLSFVTARPNSEYYQWVKRRWVTCMASRLVMTNLVSNMVKKKQLADLTVEYDLSWGAKIDDLQDCIDELTPILQAGGNISPGSSLPLSTTIKGLNHPDYPEFGRGFVAGERGGGNTHVYKTQGNRKTKTYRSRRAKGKSGTDRRDPFPSKWGSGSGY